MSEKIKAKIGEELYNKILGTGLKAEEFDIVNDGSWITKSRFNEINNKLKATDKKIIDYEKQINDTKELLKDSEDFKEQYNLLDEKYKADIALKDKEILDTSKKFLVENQLRDSGAKHTSLLMNTIDFDKISIENGNLLGMSDILEGLKQDYSDLFTTKQSGTNNNISGNIPNNNQNNNNDEIDWEEKLKDI